MVTTIVVVIALIVGFCVGRVKNIGKLASIRAEIDGVESAVSADVKTLVARIRAKL